MEKTILLCYRNFIENNPGIPTIKKLYDHIKYYMDVNCYDLVYEDVYKNMNEFEIEMTVIRYKNVYLKDGLKCCDCQNVVIEGWIEIGNEI